MRKTDAVKRLTEFFRDLSLSKKKKIVVGTVFFFLFFAVILCYSFFDFPYIRLRTADIQEGMIADFDLILDDDVSFVDKEATAARWAEKREKIPSHYLMDISRNRSIQKRFDEFKTKLEEARDRGLSFETFYEETEEEGFHFDSDWLRRLYDRSESGVLVETAGRILDYLLFSGIVKVNDGDLGKTVVVLKRDRENALLREEISASSLLTKETCPAVVSRELRNRSLDAESVALISGLLNEFVDENVFFSPRATAQAVAKAEAELKPVRFSFSKGEPILRKGYPVTAAQINALDYLRQISVQIDFADIIGILVYLILLFVLAKFLLDKPFLKENLQLNQMILFYSLTFFLAVFYICWDEFVPFPEQWFAGLFLPMGLAAFTAVSLASSAAAVYLTLMTSAGLVLFFRADASTVILTVFSGIGAAVSLRKVERREDLLKAGGRLAAVQAVVALSVALFYDYSPLMTAACVVTAAFNAFLSAVVTLGLLPLFEKGLNFATPFRLMELTDRNLPIFKKMSALAPGTYAHTMAVASYAEAAAREIGADALLARCGAFYHDIGKIDQPEFFAENQVGFNKHDEIQPNLSIVVIKSHVVNGVNKAKALHLPQKVIDIIEQHHGNSVITYFYVQALRQGKSVPTEEDFSYKTPLPQSKEAGIVMIADVVEAATRSLPSPVSVVQVEKFIDKIISDKINNNQFIESRLTFSDVNTVKAVLLRMVCSSLHTRPEYPEKSAAGKEKRKEDESN